MAEEIKAVEQEKEGNTIKVEEKTSREFPFFRILYKNLLLIIIITVLAGAIGTVLGFMQAKPVYTAKCDVILSVGNNDTSTQDTSNYAKGFMPTVADLLTSPKLLAEARNIRGDYGISSGGIAVSYGDTLIFSLSYSDVSKELAVRRLEDVLDAAKNKLAAGDEMPLNIDEMHFTETQNDYIVTVKDNLAIYIFTGFIIGFVLGIVIALLTYILDNKVKSNVELEEIAGVGMLAIIEKQED